MYKNKNLIGKLSSYLYKLGDIKHVRSVPSLFSRKTSMFTLLLFKEASGEIIMNGRSYPLHKQQVFLVSPNVSVEFLFDRDDSIDYYHLQFFVLQTTKNHSHYVTTDLKYADEIFTSYFDYLLGRVEEIQKKQQSQSPWDVMSGNIIFQELLVALFKANFQEQKRDVNQAIKSTQDYIEQHFSLNITREYLAALSGMSPDYYSRVFKCKIGKSPMEYLTEVRINRAKQLLILSKDPLRSIANSVGFNDEFYFSRKFKAVTGFSPTAYVERIKNSSKIASLKHLLTGHLVALGIEPYATVKNHAYPISNQLRHTISIGDYQPNLEKLISVNPDLILTCEFRDFEKSQKEKLYDQIASTITLPFFQDWRIHFQTIAKVVGKEVEARRWLENYERKAENIRKQLKKSIGEENILIVGIGDGKMCVYGKRNVGTVLYGDLHLAFPKGVEQIDHYKEITLEDLAEFDADRILLTTYQHDGTEYMDQAIQDQVNALYAHTVWKNLKAVQNGAIYCLHDTQHLYTCYTSLSHDLLLDKINGLVHDAGNVQTLNVNVHGY
ncbi:AraC family transcriptional regulator [Peribacillus asahii]|uniref:AraC family transcriptional regulator n=1 Tax=Peribacillus asahii TaxID=228899 RepID=UPI002079E526|nr:helix-turn-helix domain-containing protein [Peribacillus asahii]USK83733.1 helix-turn-helix domain-containing protein [Peribacillus asahii]